MKINRLVAYRSDDIPKLLGVAVIYFLLAYMSNRYFDSNLLVGTGGILSLTVDPPVSFARPSVDVLFESAADVFGSGAIGVILTGANHDGSQGLQAIKRRGGYAIVQDPLDAEVKEMPRSALAATQVDHVLALKDIAPLLMQLARSIKESKRHVHV